MSARLYPVAAATTAGASEFILPAGGILMDMNALALSGLQDGDPLGVVPDNAGSSRYALCPNAAGNPVYRDNAINGLPAMELGAHPCDTLRFHGDIGISSPGRCTTIQVVKVIQLYGSPGGWVDGASSTGNRGAHYFSSAGRPQFVFAGSYPGNSSGPAVPLHEPTVVVHRTDYAVDRGILSAFINGELVYELDRLRSGAAVSIRWFPRNWNSGACGGTERLHGLYGRVIIYNRALSDQEVRRAVNSLKKEWRIPL